MLSYFVPLQFFLVGFPETFDIGVVPQVVDAWASLDQFVSADPGGGAGGVVWDWESVAIS